PDPSAGTIYVWYDALTNYLTGAGFPADPDSFARWWPADLHVIGKDISRFHTIQWPAMLMSAGLELPRLVWVHGFMHVQGEKMSKSRGNFFDPNDMVAALGSDGARYVTLQEVPFDRDSDVSWDSFIRRYNADLANDFGNLVNRSLTMAGRYLGGQRPPVAEEPPGGRLPLPRSPLAETWTETLYRYRERLDALYLHEAVGVLWEIVAAANRFVDAEQPWALAKRAQGEEPGAEGRLRAILGDLIEACRVIALAAAPFMPGTAPRVLAQLGYDYPYGSDGNGGPPLVEELRWGARAGQLGALGNPEPLFPRLDVGADD
ncbi:MAG: class I tRNA ligase family protein, partial [Chloroflexota bacterium]|nr:class I tRNA ligase family protein [Chloroflexota bacterium]